MTCKTKTLEILLVCFPMTLFFHYGYSQQNTARKTLIFDLDLRKSIISWKAPKAMGNRHFGTLKFSSGVLNLSPGGMPVNGIIITDMNSIKNKDHGTASLNQKVDKELKSDEFFNVREFPSASMSIRQITPFNKSSVFQVSGSLTMKGITHPISLMATIIRNKNAINVSGELAIDRRQWNIHPEPGDFFGAIKNQFIGDEIPLAFHLVFHQK